MKHEYSLRIYVDSSYLHEFVVTQEQNRVPQFFCSVPLPATGKSASTPIHIMDWCVISLKLPIIFCGYIYIYICQSYCKKSIGIWRVLVRDVLRFCSHGKVSLLKSGFRLIGTHVKPLWREAATLEMTILK